jgi:hypothetical protein
MQLIAITTTRTALNVRCGIDSNRYPRGIKVSDEENGHNQHHASRVSWRVELYHRSQAAMMEG